MSVCANRCYEIGGPWITADPDCPLHGVEACHRESLLQDRISRLEDENLLLRREIAEVRAIIEDHIESVKSAGYWRNFEP